MRIVHPNQANKYEMQIVDRGSVFSGAKPIQWRSSKKASGLVIAVRAVDGGDLEVGGRVT